MKKFIDYVGRNSSEIYMMIVLSTLYLVVIGFTYFIFDQAIPHGMGSFVVSVFIYAIETLLYLTELLSIPNSGGGVNE